MRMHHTQHDWELQKLRMKKTSSSSQCRIILYGVFDFLKHSLSCCDGHFPPRAVLLMNTSISGKTQRCCPHAALLQKIKSKSSFFALLWYSSGPGSSNMLRAEVELRFAGCQHLPGTMCHCQCVSLARRSLQLHPHQRPPKPPPHPAPAALPPPWAQHSSWSPPGPHCPSWAQPESHNSNGTAFLPCQDRFLPWNEYPKAGKRKFSFSAFFFSLFAHPGWLLSTLLPLLFVVAKKIKLVWPGSESAQL